MNGNIEYSNSQDTQYPGGCPTMNRTNAKKKEQGATRCRLTFRSFFFFLLFLQTISTIQKIEMVNLAAVVFDKKWQSTRNPQRRSLNS